MFKNIRNHLEKNYYLPDSLAPSYFLECLLYNVPDRKFGGSFQDTFCNVINWLVEANFNDFVCQNEQSSLFGDTPEQWSIHQAKEFIQNLVRLWNDW